MADTILVPQVGQDLTEAKVVAIHVKLGDAVKRGDIVAEVESEKANFEVEAFASGVVIALPYKAGDTATVLEPLMVLGQPGEIASSDEPAKLAEPAAAAAVQAAQPPMAAASAAGGTMRSSPLARRIAASHGVSVAEIAGTGPGSAVVLRDVEAFVAAKPARNAAQQRPALQLVSSGSSPLRRLRDGTGHPVLFLHGFGGDLSTWRAFVGRLSLSNPLLALDLPGHGASMAEASSFDGLVDAVAGTLAAEGLASLHLVGHSLGAAVAVGLSGRGDCDIRSLTLLSPAGLGPTIDGGFIEGFLDARTEAALAAQMHRLVFDPTSLPGAAVRATLAAREDATLVERQRRLAEAVFEGSTQLFSVRDALKRFEGPVRVVAGRRDGIIPLSETEAALPGHVALHRLEHVGHFPYVELPGLVGRLVTDTVRSGE